MEHTRKIPFCTGERRILHFVFSEAFGAAADAGMNVAREGGEFLKQSVSTVSETLHTPEAVNTLASNTIDWGVGMAQAGTDSLKSVVRGTETFASGMISMPTLDGPLASA